MKKALTDSVREIKNPGTRAFIYALLIAVMVLFGIFIGKVNSNADDLKEQKKDCDQARRDSDRRGDSIANQLRKENEIAVSAFQRKIDSLNSFILINNSKTVNDLREIISKWKTLRDK